ncbi:adenylate/guanylate cyclase domain-containing protein [Taklimakanibacter deserti]|uniref:adenylate/guanylate cyclase domain-containing protein n=1 Tax=Taklimakanibacter deserti TaxID=2267839 RepID=UPI000E653718
MVEHAVERRLAAILAADMVGYSRLMGKDEAGTLAALKAVRAEVIDPKVAEHNGRVFKATGDGVLAEFPSVVNAVACAVAIQQQMVSRSTGGQPEQQIDLRIGINIGDVIVDGDDVFGDGVNVAARLEGIASPGEVVVSSAVRDHIGNRLDLLFDDLGDQQLKNISMPVRSYRVRLGNNEKSQRLDSVPSTKTSIAVLPFTNMSSDHEQEYFVDGLSEDLITSLSKIPELFVIARHSTFAYKGKSIDLRQVARELGADHIIEGSVRRAGRRVRVTAQLIEAKSGGHLWADRFDRDLEDIFAVQDEVVANIVSSLSMALPASRTRRERHVPSIEAYDLFVRGRALSVDTIEKTTLAYPLLERVIELDPDFSDAHAWLAMNLIFQFIDSGKGEMEKILSAAKRAVSLDPENALGHFALGYAIAYSGDLREGRVEFELALRFNPNHADAWLYLADLEVLDGRPEAAVSTVERALRLNPYPHATYYWLWGFALYAARRYEEAARHLEHPSCRGTGSQRIRAAALAQLGQLNQAHDVSRQFMTNYPKFTTSGWAKTQPFRDPRDLQHFVDGYIKAGLPA